MYAVTHQKRSLFLHACTCAIAAIALVVAFSRGSAESVRREVYEQVVADVASELAPLYQDLRLPAAENPRTIGEAIRPLLGLSAGHLQIPSIPGTGPATRPTR